MNQSYYSQNNSLGSKPLKEEPLYKFTSLVGLLGAGIPSCFKKQLIVLQPHYNCQTFEIMSRYVSSSGSNPLKEITQIAWAKIALLGSETLLQKSNYFSLWLGFCRLPSAVFFICSWGFGAGGLGDVFFGSISESIRRWLNLFSKDLAPEGLLLGIRNRLDKRNLLFSTTIQF
jgi:hypothetical protein